MTVLNPVQIKQSLLKSITKDFHLLLIGDGTKISTATDVHGLGMILWEMKTAEKPYDNLSLEAICQHKGQGGQLHLPSDMLDEVKELICRCWNQEPTQRHNIYIRTISS
jgi:hypothetical protein